MRGLDGGDGTICVVIGTRPEAIKLAPVVLALKRERDVPVKVIATAQHRALLDDALAHFGVTSDYDLNVMSQAQTPVVVAARVMADLEPILRNLSASWVVVQGDTVTAAAAAWASFLCRSRVAHVEAGLRTRNKWYPFPEEICRRVVGVCADLHFAPTSGARSNLIAEGVPEELIHVTGNTVIDALRVTSDAVSAPSWRPANDQLAHVLRTQRKDSVLVLVTAHRRESLGAPLHEIHEAVRKLAARFQDRVQFVLPVHPNPDVSAATRNVLTGLSNVVLTEPLSYPDLVALLLRAHFVMTDSGGLQEEAPFLGKPVLVLRDETERPEAVQSGVAWLTGPHEQRIYEAASRLILDASLYSKMARRVSPYGDGYAAERICRVLRAATMGSAGELLPSETC